MNVTNGAMTTRIGKPADTLNRECECKTLDPEALKGQLGTGPEGAALYRELAETRPNLFSNSPVFVSAQDVASMRTLIAAIEHVVALPAYQHEVLQWAPVTARHDFGPRGAFLGYDFHLSATGPRLIEINTNAGGALLNAVLARAQLACCKGVDMVALPDLERTLFEMFAQEWRYQRGDATLGRVAIVDDAPTEQYLYPEFRLFERLFHAHGVDAVIVDAAALEYQKGGLWFAGERIDLIYNRLTDFALLEPAHVALRAAFEEDAVVVTPHPRAHALYADKRNLVVLSDETALRRLGVAEGIIATLLAGVPRTVRVSADNIEALWAARRELFFKPAAGFGSRAAYRGDKLTRRVFADIANGDYIAQALVPPTERRVRVGDETVTLKFDLRDYVYEGQVQLLAARLYQGQTTNFRTAGGGFAPVFYPTLHAQAEPRFKEMLAGGMSAKP